MKAEMKRRPSFNQMLEHGFHPTDNLKSPYIAATLIAKSQETSRCLDSATFDSQKDHGNIALQHDRTRIKI
jgi:hypothetical protein